MNIKYFRSKTCHQVQHLHFISCNPFSVTQSHICHIFNFCQTPVLGLGLGVDFVFPLSQEEEEQEEEPPTKIYKKEEYGV